MDKDINFDVCVGVSAGSANMVSYMAGQRGRNYDFYYDYSFRPEYISLSNYTHTGSYLDLDYVYSDLTNEGCENPLDFNAMNNSSKELVVVATNANTGKPKYFTKQDMQQDNYDVLKASCCIPIINKPYEVSGVPYIDGGVSDPIPVQKALDMGCDKVVLVLTKPRDFYLNGRWDKVFSNLMRGNYKGSAEAVKNRPLVYNEELDFAKSLERQGIVQIISPSKDLGMGTFTKDKSKLDELYHLGYSDAKQINI